MEYSFTSGAEISLLKDNRLHALKVLCVEFLNFCPEGFKGFIVDILCLVICGGSFAGSVIGDMELADSC